jgi:hypothetical protein
MTLRKVQTGHLIMRSQRGALLLAAVLLGFYTQPAQAREYQAPTEVGIALGAANVGEGFSMGRLTGGDATAAVSSRYFLAAQYRLNEYFGIEGGATFGTLYGDWERRVGVPWSESFIPALAFNITPVSIHFFGSSMLELTVQAGMIYDSSLTGRTQATLPDRSREREFKSFAALAIDWNIDPRISVQVASRMMIERKASGADFSTLSLVFHI